MLLTTLFITTHPHHICISLLDTAILYIFRRVTNRFFVPPTEKQLQMTGRLWRHGLPMMPHMIAGVGGPAEIQPPRHSDAAPATVRPGSLSPAFEGEDIDDGHGPGCSYREEADEVLPDPVVPDVVSSTKYKRLFGALPLHQAVLDVYCRMALLGGRLMGDNMAETTRMTAQQMQDLAEEAQTFIVEYVDVVFGPVHTTKAHRLANHLLATLLGNGNLWEGDTSENESLHGPCKKMYNRSNNRGPRLILQMMRASETQKEVLRELRELGSEEDNDDDDDINRLLEDPDVVDPDVQMVQPASLTRSHRGTRMTIGDAEKLPGLFSLSTLLGRRHDCSVVVANSAVFRCTFEWGASSVVQTVCAAESYSGKPRYDHLWYKDGSGNRQLGRARLVVRMLDGVANDFVVLQRLEEVPSSPQCSLTQSGCKRVAWRFDTPQDDWPSLARVPVEDVLRVEHVVADFQDLADRRGLRAVPSNAPDTAAERHSQRFFTNVFYPFTSRVLNPSS